MVKRSSGKSGGIVAASTVAALSALQQMNAALALVPSLDASDVLPVKPEGWFTLDEYRAQATVPVETARSRVKSLLKAGKLEQKRAYCVNSYGRNYPTFIYRLCPKSA